MSNAYWTGTTLAHLASSDISAPWGRGNRYLTRIDFANHVFQFWHDARRSIAACRDSAHQTAMTAELEDAGRTGSGLFIDDLEEAFEHLHANSGRWTDDTTSSSYSGGPDQVFRRGGHIPNLPRPLVNFADAVDDKFQEFCDGAPNFGRQSQIILQQLRSSSPNWEQVGNALSQIDDWGTRVKPLLWAQPNVSRAVGSATTYAGALSNIHTGLTAYVTARRAGFPEGPAAAFSVLRTAVGYVPILGSYYGAMVDLLPALRTWYTNLIAQRVRDIDRAAHGRP